MAGRTGLEPAPWPSTAKHRAGHTRDTRESEARTLYDQPVTSQARGFESRFPLQVSCSPSVGCAGGVVVGRKRLAIRGRIGLFGRVPGGCKVRESKILVLDWHRMGVGTEGQLRIAVAEQLGDPANGARSQRSSRRARPDSNQRDRDQRSRRNRCVRWDWCVLAQPYRGRTRNGFCLDARSAGAGIDSRVQFFGAPVLGA